MKPRVKPQQASSNDYPMKASRVVDALCHAEELAERYISEQVTNKDSNPNAIRAALKAAVTKKLAKRTR